MYTSYVNVKVISRKNEKRIKNRATKRVGGKNSECRKYWKVQLTGTELLNAKKKMLVGFVRTCGGTADKECTILKRRSNAFVTH